MGRSSHVPIRTCVGCGQRASQGSMLRLRYDDRRGLAPVTVHGEGRSAYVHQSPQCIRALVKSRLLKRSLRRSVERDCRSRAAAQMLEMAQVG